jgi:hypothetical protein
MLEQNTLCGAIQEEVWRERDSEEISQTGILKNFV